MRSTLSAALLLLAASTLTAPAGHAQALFEALILSGDPAPQAGGSYSNPDDFRMNGAGACSFASEVAAGSASDGVFLLDAAGVQQALALQGGAIPGRTPAGVFGSRFENIDLNEAGEALFFGEDASGADLLIVDRGGVQTLVYDADPGSGQPAGTVGHATLNEAGEVAYTLVTASGPMLFVFSMDVTRQVLLELPGAVAIVAVDALGLGENGRAVAIVRDATLQHVVAEPPMSGPLVVVASQAAAAPGVSADFESFQSLLTRGDRSSFFASLDGFPIDAYFQADSGSAGQLVAAILDQDPQGDAIGPVVADTNSLDALGNTCFCTGSGVVPRGCYCADASGVNRVVARQGMNLPGGLDFEFGFATATGANGVVAFEASASQALQVRRAIYSQQADLSVFPVAEQGQPAPRTDAAVLVGEGTLVGVADDTAVFSQWDFDAPESSARARANANASGLPVVGVGLFRSVPEPPRVAALASALVLLSALAKGRGRSARAARQGVCSARDRRLAARSTHLE